MADPAPSVSELVVTPAAQPPAGGVRMFQPKVSVIVRKNIGRSSGGGSTAASERYKGAAREIDLTPYLGQNSAVVVSRSVREPAGMFSISLADQMTPDSQDSIYGLVEPMDVVEIRMARSAEEYVGQAPKNLPIVMRGFISEVRRGKSMTDRGPQRSVVITGQDYGKILQIMRITYLPGMVLGQDLLTAWLLFMNYGVDTSSFDDASKFVINVVEKVVLKFLDQMRGAGGGGTSPVENINVEATVGNGSIAPFGSQEWPGGSVYDLLKYFGDVGPWNELFFEDRDDGPWLIYRPTPFKTVDGDYIQPVEGEAKVVNIFDDALIELSISRSDANVANYYWVDAPRLSLIDGAMLQAAAAALADGVPDWYLRDYPNSSPKFYGIRLMETQTQQGLRLDGDSEEKQQEGVDVSIGFTQERRRVLIANNRDNIVFEQGEMHLRGNERITAGCYVRLGQGDKGMNKSDYYAHQVQHVFLPLRSFTTTVSFDRGTGFIDRIAREGGAGGPYLSELNLAGSYD